MVQDVIKLATVTMPLSIIDRPFCKRVSDFLTINKGKADT